MPGSASLSIKCKELFDWSKGEMRRRSRGAWKLEPVSWAQKKFIEELSSLNNKNEEDISNFLKFLRKKDTEELNKGQARDLISKLLERPPDTHNAQRIVYPT